MSNPMMAEKLEESSSSRSSSSSKRRERKMWKKKPIKVSRLPSFGFSSSDFTIDQIPTIFTGYTAESEDSSSSEMSDDSRTDENEEEINQERSRSVKRLSNLKSMKILMRQSTRKFSGGGGAQRLKKMRSMKRLTSNSRHLLKKKNLDSIPHYLRPTSSSASKNVEKIQNNLGGGVAISLKRTSSLRYNGLLKATTSSAMKGYKKSNNDVCTYRYCSLHGTLHSHGGENDNVPSLKRFVSMRRKFMKRQKSVNRRLVLLKRSLSRKRGPLGGGIVSDQESKQEDGNESNGRSWETETVDADDSNGDGGMDSRENVASPRKQWVKESGELDLMEVVASPRKQWVKESIPEIMDVSDERIDEALKGNVAERRGIDLDDEEVEGTKSVDIVEVCREGSSGEILEIMDGLDGRIDQDLTENAAQWHDTCKDIVMDIDHDNGKVERTKSEETVEDNEEVCREEDGMNTENVWNDTVTLVKQAFDEILAEITDGADSSDSSSSEMQPIKEKDTHLTVIVSTSHTRGAKKWGYLKRVIVLKRFLKSLNRREKKRKKLSDGEENEKIMKLRRELVGGKKNAEEWMLDHALRQVISTLAPSQKRKVKHLVKAFESLIPMDSGNNETVNSQTISRDIKETDLEEAKLTSEALESKSDASSSHLLALEEELDGTVSTPVISQTILRDDRDTTDLVEVLPGNDLEETKLTSEASDEALESNADASSSEKLDEKTGDSENQNLSTWRNLIQKHMVVTRDNSERKRDETEEDAAAVKWFQEAFETILSEIPDDEEIVSESSKEEKGETKSSWNSLRKVILLKRFVSSLEKARVFNPRKSRNLLLPVESELEKENVLLRHRSTMDRRRRDGEELMLDYALRQAISRLAPIQRKKVGLLVQAFDTVLDGHESHKQSKNSDTSRNHDEEANKDEQRIANVFSRFQVHQKDLKEEEKEVDSTPKSGEEGTPRVDEGCEDDKDEQRIKSVFSRFQVRQKDLKEEEKEIDSTPKSCEEGTPRVEEGCEDNKDEQRIKNVFSRFQLHQRDLKGEDEEVDSTPMESRNLPPFGNAKQRIIVENKKDSRMWKLIYKHMVTEKEEGTESVDSVESECDDDANARRSGTVKLVREALEKILSEIPDNSSDDQSIDSDITTDQERNSQFIFKPKSNEKKLKGWNNVKKVILLKRFVSDLGSLNKLSPKTPPRFLPWEPDPETEKIRLRHQEIGGKRNSEEWMLDYALRQAISTLAPSQKRKVSLLAQAFDTISLQDDVGSCSSRNISRQSSLQDVGSFSRNISRQSSISSTTVHSGNEGNEANAEIIRGKLINLQEDLKETAVANDLEEKQQCSSLWRLLCKQMEDNERNQTQTLPEETKEEEEEENEAKEDEKMEVYQTEAVELLGEVIDGISIEESQETRRKIETTSPVSQVKINRWGNLKRVILLRRFVKALENVRKFNPREPRFLPLDPEVEAEKVNLRHQEIQNKRNGEEWMVDNALQEVVSKLTPARKLKVQLLVQAFESLSATGN